MRNECRPGIDGAVNPRRAGKQDESAKLIRDESRNGQIRVEKAKRRKGEEAKSSQDADR
jgi:hypothetical protein